MRESYFIGSPYCAGDGFRSFGMCEYADCYEVALWQIAHGYEYADAYSHRTRSTKYKCSCPAHVEQLRSAAQVAIREAEKVAETTQNRHLVIWGVTATIVAPTALLLGFCYSQYCDLQKAKAHADEAREAASLEMWKHINNPNTIPKCTP